MITLPKITLTNVRYYESMSEETSCFEATLLADGVKLGRVSNRGHGGAHEYGFNSRDLDARIKATGHKTTLNLEDRSFDIETNLDILVDEALETHLLLQQAKRNILAVKSSDGKVYTFPKKRGEKREDVEGVIRRRHPGFRLLSDMPEDEQLRHLRAM